MASISKEFLVERQGRTFVLYQGLLDLAHQQGLRRITTRLVQVPSEENNQTAIVHAEVETERGVFDGIGDASPANVSRPMLTATIRFAETRAKARALRDAVNVGVAALEEIDDDEAHQPSQPAPRTVNPAPSQPAPRPQPPTGIAPPPRESTDQPMTDAQRKAIFSIASTLNIGEQALEDEYGVGLANLTKVTASQVISQLQERQKAARR